MQGQGLGVPPPSWPSSTPDKGPTRVRGGPCLGASGKPILT